jgi:SAM-dependent methyltransferase
MRTSAQDGRYLASEGDAFFRRNFEGKEPPELRPNKAVILEAIQSARIAFRRVLEYGCNYGDLLARLRDLALADECRGIEASSAAVAFGRERYGDRIVLDQGTIADNPVNSDEGNANRFDLVIVDDVLSWVSRETILQSAANIDSALAEGGFLFIRDFFPDRKVKNINHHVADGSVFNFKVPGSHAAVFLATGMYEIHWQKIWYDDIGMSTDYKCDNPFNYRWTDAILRKSHRDWFSESRKTP